MKTLTISICVLLLLIMSALPVSAMAEVYYGEVETLGDGTKIVPLMVKNVKNLGSCDIYIKFSDGVTVTDVTSGDGNALTVQTKDIDNTENTVRITAWDAARPHDGNQVLCNIVYEGSDSNPFENTIVELYDYDSYYKILHTGNNYIERSFVLVEDVIAAPNGYAFTSIMVNSVTYLGSGKVIVTFDPALIQVISVTSGEGNALIVQDWNIDNTAGLLTIAALDADESHSGNVIFANVTLQSLGDHLSSTSLVISSSELVNYDTFDQMTHNVIIGTLDTIAPSVIIDNVEAVSGESITAMIMINNASNLGSGSIIVTYNSSVVHVTNVTSGDGNALAVQQWNVDSTTGSLEITAWDAYESHNGDVVFAHVTLHTRGEYPDSTPLDISSLELIDYTSYDSIGHIITNGTFSVSDNEPPVITGAIATPGVILNDNGRSRASGTNVTVLNATVIDSGSGVMNVTIDLSLIGGSGDQVMKRIAGTDVWTVATTATNGINLTHELVVTAIDVANNTNTSVIELTVLLRGDVVRDGNLNSADVLYIAKYLVGKESMPSLLVGDMSPDTGDGMITSADALYLAKYLVGKEAAP